MSSLIYIASNHPLREVPNPHGKTLSVNEALALGIDVSEHLLKPGIDRDWKHAIYWSDRKLIIDLDKGCVEDGNFDDDFSILPLDISHEDIRTTKKYRSAIECRWTQGRAQAILSYLRAQLEATDCVELWHIYTGCDERPKLLRYEAHIEEFTPEDLIEIANLPIYDKKPIHHCVTITK